MKYCGTGGIVNPFEKMFNEACKQHDIDYDNINKDRKEADVEFLERMMSASKGKKRRRVHILRAYLYYGIVRLVGFLSKK